MTTEWTATDRAAAQAEGWDIFYSNGVPQLQKLDQPKKSRASTFVNDRAVWQYVKAQAQGGSELHTKALSIIREESPDEWECIKSV